MRIQRLYIKKYKILDNLDTEFNNSISVFIGINGSGKSSILEALALIFSNAYEQIFNKRKELSPIKDCEVEYLLRYETISEMEALQAQFNIDYIPVKLLLDSSGVATVVVNVDTEKENELFKYLSGKYSPKDLLPRRVVIYYSGISEHMSDIYKVNEANILKQLRKDPKQTKDGYVMPVSIPLFLFHESEFTLLLASLFAYGFNQRVKDVLYSKLKIQHPEGIFLRIEINRKDFDKKFEKTKRDEIDREMMLIQSNDSGADLSAIREKFLQQYFDERVDNFFGATGRLSGFLRQLRESSSNKLQSYDVKRDAYFFDFTINQWQTFSEDVLRDPKKIFEMLFMLKHNGLLKNLGIKVFKNTIEIDSHLLSEGEKQLIIICALNEALGVNNSVFLFDEPDNFLHPSLQDDLVRNIEENYGNDEVYQNHYFVTTHNPSFLNNLNPEHGEVLIIRDGKILPHSLKWYGRDVNEIINQIMNSEYRPRWALEEIDAIDMLIEEKNIAEAKKKLTILAIRFSDTDAEIVRLQSKLDFFID